jgi:hypothetical protein
VTDPTQPSSGRSVRLSVVLAVVTVVTLSLAVFPLVRRLRKVVENVRILDGVETGSVFGPGTED